jgi:hypothetical protein
VQLAQLVVRLGERKPAVNVDLERLGGNVGGGHVRIDPSVDAHRPSCDPPLALELRDRLREHLDVELEPEGGDVTRLLRSEQIAGAANLEIPHRDLEARAELGVVGQRGQARAGLG